MSLKVTQLAIYPVKSLGMISLPTVVIDEFGPAADRRFMVADSSGKFLTQREYPKMCLVNVIASEHGFELSAPSMPPLEIEPNSGHTAGCVNLWGDSVETRDMGDQAANWFSRYLGIDARLHYMPDDSIRQVDMNYGKSGDRVSFTDGFPILLITEASLREFNSAWAEPVGADRFRPNIVIDGDVPYAEDTWKRLRIGALEFDVVKPCSRCVIPSIDPRTARKQPEVVQALAKTRRRGNAVYFGQNLIHRSIGAIHVGDTVVVVE
jgi:uncharacterized protein YcbX